MSQILLHIGYAKAGSSFLGNWFHMHPDFVFKDFAFGGFYNTHQIMKSAISKTDMSEKVFVVRDTRFTSPSQNDFKSTTEIEKVQKEIALTLYSLFPEAKILIVTRGFETAIKANYSQYVKEGGILTFSKLIRKNKDNDWLPYNYNYIYNLYSDIFGKENILLIPFELLKKDQNIFLKKIEDFLKISHFPCLPLKTNESLTPQGMELIRIINVVLYYFLYISGPFQPSIYRLHIKLLDTIKTKSWNNSFFRTISGFLKNQPLQFESVDNIRRKFSGFSTCFRNNVEYNTFKNEYFID